MASIFSAGSADVRMAILRRLISSGGNSLRDSSSPITLRAVPTAEKSTGTESSVFTSSARSTSSSSARAITRDPSGFFMSAASSLPGSPPARRLKRSGVNLSACRSSSGCNSNLSDGCPGRAVSRKAALTPTPLASSAPTRTASLRLTPKRSTSCSCDSFTLSITACASRIASIPSDTIVS